MKIYLAPMEGVVDYFMRDWLTSVGGFDQCTTEFIRVTDRLNPQEVFFRYCPELKTAGKTRSGVPVFVQLLGGKPEPMGENANIAVELGAPGIDLNFGCPAKTVNRHDGGAALLQKPSRLFDVISAVKKAVAGRVPVTAKVRLGYENKDLCLEIADAVEAAQPAALTIHARTKMEMYRPPAHWEFIAKMKERLSLPVIANGDIWSVEDALRCQKISGCADLMVGRGALSRPDLALQIRNPNADLRLKWSDLLPRVLAFGDLAASQTSDRYSLNRLKQFLRYLANGYPEAAQLFQHIKICQTYQELRLGLISSEETDLTIRPTPSILRASERGLLHVE